MRLKRILKISLLIISIALTGFLVALMYIVFYIENARFEYSMLIPLFMIPAGVLSVVYHFKTMRFYGLKSKATGFKDVVLWVGNTLFAISQVLTAFYLLYSLYLLYQTNQNTEVYIAYMVCLLMFVFGLCLFLETYHLYKRIIKTDADLFKGSIDDITGVDKNQD